MDAKTILLARSLGCFLVLSGVGVASTTPALAQIPEEFTNLKVFPEDISRRELVGAMRGFTRSLGMRCATCHMGEDSEPLSTYDFASDEKPVKVKARAMLRMVAAINNEHLANLPDRGEPNVGVTCTTCHAGINRPVPIDEEVSWAIEEGGVELGVARYLELRERYHGSRAYDFSDRPLQDLAQGLERGGDTASALRIAQLNVEFYPESVRALVTLAAAQESVGDNPSAIETYRHVLELDPENRVAQLRLEELGGG